MYAVEYSEVDASESEHIFVSSENKDEFKL